jgi:hypothetical protein|tara:strand:- start:310 stop:414 length:105 start_codon:yes stop_codon:yes gene_type:complete
MDDFVMRRVAPLQLFVFGSRRIRQAIEMANNRDG